MLGSGDDHCDVAIVARRAGEAILPIGDRDLGTVARRHLARIRTVT
jgi:hypothetical protein